MRPGACAAYTKLKTDGQFRDIKQRGAAPSVGVLRPALCRVLRGYAGLCGVMRGYAGLCGVMNAHKRRKILRLYVNGHENAHENGHKRLKILRLYYSLIINGSRPVVV